MSKSAETTIAAARRSFNDELLSADYADIHCDEAQIGRLVGFLAPRPGGRYLDLATGSGAVAFALAARHPEAEIHGIDIAHRAIGQNRRVADDLGRRNVKFHTANGRTIDFPDASFDGIAWRYALHHFPDLPVTIAHARRVLRPGGTFAVADAVRHPDDHRDFINRFQALKPDGHVRIYDADALVALFGAQGFQAAERFDSTIAFTRVLDPATRALIAATPKEILALYGVRHDGERAALRFGVVNVRFLAPSE